MILLPTTANTLMIPTEVNTEADRAIAPIASPLRVFASVLVTFWAMLMDGSRMSAAEPEIHRNIGANRAQTAIIGQWLYNQLTAEAAKNHAEDAGKLGAGGNLPP